MAELIVAIDDDEELLELVRKTLELDGYQVITASDGKTGLDLVFKHLPDLVILDLMMPGLTGYAVCEKIKNGRSTKNTPVLILTAKNMSTDIELALEKGADWYITKPFDPQYLQRNVRKLIRNKKTILTAEESPAKTPAKNKILIVDDDSDVLATTKDVLESRGYETLTAQDAASGLQLAQSVKPDLIIIDIMLPGDMDGYALCSLISSDPSTSFIPILILTGKNLWEDAEKALEKGAAWYVTKPYDINRLVTTVKKLISQKR